MDFKPLFKKLIHSDEFIEVIRIFMVFHKSLIGIIISFKITLRLQRFCDYFSSLRKTSCDHHPKWLSEVSILYFRDLTEAVRETPVLSWSLRADRRALFQRIPTVGTSECFIAYLKITFRTLN